MRTVTNVTVHAWHDEAALLFDSGGKTLWPQVTVAAAAVAKVKAKPSPQSLRNLLHRLKGPVCDIERSNKHRRQQQV